MKRRVKLLVADSSPEDGQRMKTLLETMVRQFAEEEMIVDIDGPISQAEHLLEALKAARPDVVLLNLDWKEGAGLGQDPLEAGEKLVRQINRVAPETGLFLSRSAEAEEPWRDWQSLGVDAVYPKAELFKGQTSRERKKKNVPMGEAQQDLWRSLLSVSRNVAGYFVECVRRQRVKFVFGVPGSEVMPILRAVNQLHLSCGMKFILTASEQGAAFMADTIGRLSPGRVPGVCISTLGPGATNLLTGVANAWEDKSPMVVVTGQVPAIRSGKESHQSENTMGIFQPFTTYRKRIESPSAEETAAAVSIAFKASRTERQRPAFIEIPVNIQQERCRDSFAIPMIEPYGNPDPETADPLRLPRAPMDSILQAAEAIANARRPVMLIGPGATRPAENQGALRTSRVLNEMIHRYKIPVVHTFMGKGVVNERECPYVLPVAGTSQKDLDLDLFNRVFDASDLVITVGYDFYEFDCKIWNRFRGVKDNQMNIVSITYLEPQIEAFFAPRYFLTGSIAGNVKALLLQMDALDRGSKKHFPWRGTVWERIPRMLRKQLAEEIQNLPLTSGRLSPGDVIRELIAFSERVRSEMDREVLLISDVGLHKMWLARYYPAPHPDSTLIPNGFSPMGYAIPSAIGAALLHTGDEVFRKKRGNELPPVIVAVVGDGGFRMSGMEFATAVQNKLAIIVVLIRDNKMGLVAFKENLAYGNETSDANDLPAADYAAMARAMGGRGMKVPERDLAGCLQDAAMSVNIPTLIDVATDQSTADFSCIQRNVKPQRRKDLREKLLAALREKASDKVIDCILREQS